MTKIRALFFRARALALICALFAQLTLARLAQWRRVLHILVRFAQWRRAAHPTRARFTYSGFRRFACLAMSAVLIVQFSLFPPDVAHAAVKGVSAKAVNSAQDARLWWHSSGWAARMERLRNEFLPSIGAQTRRQGWDGRGAPRYSRPAAPEIETRQDREQKVARVKIFPGNVEIKTGEQVVFNAVAFDRDGNPVSGLDAQWSALHEDKNLPITVSRGTFVSAIPGKFILTADVAGRRDHAKVTVTGEVRRPNVKSRSEAQKSSRESRRVGSLRAPVSGARKQIAGRGKRAKSAPLKGKRAATVALSGPLRAASSPMAASPTLFLPGEDETGWNSLNNDTMDDVGSERGNMPGRAVDGGFGSNNFQFSAPAVATDGRGIDLGLLFNYNSRVWHKAGSEITFDIDRDWIPGWSLGFGKIVMAGDTYMLIDGDGTRHPYQGTLRTGLPRPQARCRPSRASPPTARLSIITPKVTSRNSTTAAAKT